MKKSTLTILSMFVATCLFAQKPDSIASKQVKTKNADGAVMSSSKDVIENISGSSELTILTNAIKIADIKDNLKSSGAFTLLAPTNKAFEKLAPGQLDTLLLPLHKTDLVDLLKYHIIAGILSSKDIARQIKAGNGTATFTTLSGGIITARINENRNIVLTDENGGQSIITGLDIPHSNGMMFIINSVLLPKAKQ